MNKIKIKKGDQVIVITGENKGTKGTVLKVLYNSNKALVEGVNTVKRHTKPSSENPKGGIIEKQLPIEKTTPVDTSVATRSNIAPVSRRLQQKARKQLAHGRTTELR